MSEILTPELIQALLSAIIAIITGLFAKEKITTNQYVKYTDPNDTYNIPPKGITEGAIKVVSQDDYGKVTTTISGRISSEGRVIGEAKVELFNRDPRGVPYQEVSLSQIRKEDTDLIVAVKTSPTVSGDIVYGYSLDNQPIKVIGQNTLRTTNNAPESEWLYTRYAKHVDPYFKVGEHKITIYQGYVDGKTPLGGDNVIWWKHNDFLVDVI